MVTKRDNLPVPILYADVSRQNSCSALVPKAMDSKGSRRINMLMATFPTFHFSLPLIQMDSKLTRCHRPNLKSYYNPTTPNLRNRFLYRKHR